MLILCILRSRRHTTFSNRFFKILPFSPLFSVQYTLHLYGFFKEWRKNPQWSFACCLALALPLNDLQGDIRGLAGTHVLTSQLQTGDFEMVTLQAAVKDTGAIDITLEEGEEGDEDKIEVQDGNRQDAKYNNQNCDQGTQTEFFSILRVADVMLH